MKKMIICLLFVLFLFNGCNGESGQNAMVYQPQVVHLQYECATYFTESQQRGMAKFMEAYIESYNEIVQAMDVQGRVDYDKVIGVKDRLTPFYDATEIYEQNTETDKSVVSEICTDMRKPYINFMDCIIKSVQGSASFPPEKVTLQPNDFKSQIENLYSKYFEE